MADIVDLAKELLVFEPGGTHEKWKAEDFWKAAFSKGHPAFHKEMGYLVSRYRFTEDWNSWEKHPAGDEMIYVLSGEIRFVLEGQGDVEAKGGDAFVIPKGTWHTAKVKAGTSAEVLFFTFGYGTEHRPV